MFTLPKLDYNYNALEPFIDGATMEIHHTKHHQAYIDKLNAIIKNNSELENKSLEELAMLPESKNMAGGHLNHSFWWKLIAPYNGSEITEIVKGLKEEFNTKSLSLFGSGWVWIAKKDDKLEVISTPLQDSPIVTGFVPIMGIDLWEHSYYLKYQNRRADYVEAFWNIINWGFVNENLNSL
jgi:Fe-Mn family superoxide dismutase